MQKKKIGRPRLPEGEKKTYKRLAVYPSTHELAKQIQERSGMNMLDWLDSIIVNEAERLDKENKGDKKFLFFKR